MSLVARIFWLALAGAVGTLCRVYVGVLAQRLLGQRFPWGTLSVNLLGCFAYGIVWSLCEARGRISPETRAILLAGFMGAFTTFSSYVFDSYLLAEGSRPNVALLNVVVENLGGALCLVLGILLGRVL